MILTTFIMPRP